jgi:hypothetical protein
MVNVPRWVPCLSLKTLSIGSAIILLEANNAHSIIWLSANNACYLINYLIRMTTKLRTQSYGLVIRHNYS